MSLLLEGEEWKDMNVENNFESVNPELLIDWDYSKNTKQPKEVRVTSKERIAWKCHVCGYEWSTQALHRHYGTGCPKCSRIKAVIGKNDLKTFYPHIASEWDYEANDRKLETITVKCGYLASWKCAKGHKWKMRVADRVKRNSPCPFCSGKLVIPGVNSLQQLYPELCKELAESNDLIDPDKIKPSSKMRVHWKCNKGHVWETTIRHRAIDKSGCPYCAGKRPIPGENDLETLFPQLLKEWDWEKNTIKPSEVGCSSTRKMHWKCQYGHEWKTSVAHRTIRNSGCPYCAGQKVISGETDLKTCCPEILCDYDYERNNVSPEELHWLSRKKVSWACNKCGHKWRAQVYRRTKEGLGCPKCAR